MELPSGAVIAILGAVLYLAIELRRIEKRLAGPDDTEAERLADEELKTAHGVYYRHLDKLKQDKSELPRTDLWTISSNPDWQQDLIAKAEPLRKIVEELHGNTPDSYWVWREVDGVRMTYELAHALAELALARKEISIRKTEWCIKTAELAGLARRRSVDLARIADGQLELLELQSDFQNREQSLQGLKRDVMQAYEAALGPLGERIAAR